MSEHNKTFGISYALHMHLKQGPFSTVDPTILSCTRLRILLNTICRKPSF